MYQMFDSANREIFQAYRWSLSQEPTVRRATEVTVSSNFDFSVVYGWSSDVLGFLVEKVSGQTLEQFWYANLTNPLEDGCWTLSSSPSLISKENIFGPLGMKTSYYLTPDLHQKLVGLSFRDAEGKYNVWNDQLKIIEQDPSKGEPSF